MPIGLIVVTLSLGGGAELMRGLTAGTRLTPPSRQNAGGSAISASDGGTNGVTANSCAARNRQIIKTSSPARHALASKPASSAEW